MRNVLITIVLVLSGAATAVAQSPAASQPSSTHPETAHPVAPMTEMQKKIQSYLRDAYGFGADFTITVGDLQPSAIAELSQVNVTVGFNGQSESTLIYVSKDGKFLIRGGELDDISADPFAAVKKLLHVEGSPSKGPADARVTLVEFADYECPVCRNLDTLLRNLLPKYPTVRLVYKDFPLTDLHPWALTAAEAGHCAYTQDPAAFWKFHDSVFDSQDLISADNAFDKLVDLASQAGLNPDQLKTCMADPKTADLIQSEQAEGQALEVSSTPTIFINGRTVVGPNEQLIDQYIQFELSEKSLPPPRQ